MCIYVIGLPLISSNLIHHTFCACSLALPLIEYPEGGQKLRLNKSTSLEWSNGLGIGFDGIVAL